MTARGGDEARLELGDGLGGYGIIGGVRVGKLSLTARAPDGDTVASAWRRYAEGSGSRRAVLELSGPYTGTDAETTLLGYAVDGTHAPIRLTFAPETAEEQILTGDFLIATYERTADRDQEERYALTLESVGEVELG